MDASLGVKDGGDCVSTERGVRRRLSGPPSEEDGAPSEAEGIPVEGSNVMRRVSLVAGVGTVAAGEGPPSGTEGIWSLGWNGAMSGGRVALSNEG